MDKYEVIIFWSKEDQAFIAEAPELSGCMAHGESHEQALANLRDAMVLWIESSRAVGDAAPAPKAQRLMFA